MRARCRARTTDYETDTARLFALRPRGAAIYRFGGGSRDPGGTEGSMPRVTADPQLGPEQFG